MNSLTVENLITTSSIAGGFILSRTRRKGGRPRTATDRLLYRLIGINNLPSIPSNSRELEIRPDATGRWSAHQYRRITMSYEKLCPVHRGLCDERACGSHLDFEMGETITNHCSLTTVWMQIIFPSRRTMEAIRRQGRSWAWERPGVSLTVENSIFSPAQFPQTTHNDELAHQQAQKCNYCYPENCAEKQQPDSITSFNQ